MKGFYFFILLWFCGFAFSLRAADNTQITQEQDQILQLKQQELEEKTRKQDLERAEVERPKEITITPEQLEPKPQKCFDIKQIVILKVGEKRLDNQKDNKFVNTTILSGNDILKITSKYINKCLNVDEINNLKTEITNLYILKGYVSNSAVIGKQNLLSGVLEIRVIEAKIEGVEVREYLSFNSIFHDGFKLQKNEKPEVTKKLKSFTAYPFSKGKDLNIRDIEQAIEQINRLQSNNAAIKIIPGDANGGSKVVITNKKSARLIPFDAKYSNNGQQSTGSEVISYNLGIDDGLSMNDNFYLSYSRTNNNDRHKRYSDSIYSSFELPLGYYTFSYSLARSEFKTNVALTNGDILYSFGNTTTNTLKASRVISRGQKYKVSAEASIIKKDVRNFTEVRDLITQSGVNTRVLSVFNLDITNTFYLQNGLLLVKPSLNRGLKILNALDDSKSINEQRAQFKSYGLYIYYSKNLNIPKTKIPFNYSVTFDSLYSNDQLYGSEQMFVGSLYTVRGFRDVSVGGERAFNVRNELKFDLDKITAGTEIFKKLTSGFSISPFYDFGYVKLNSNSADVSSYRLSGTGLKLSYNKKYLTFELVYAKALNIPQTIQSEQLKLDGQNIIYTNINVKL